MLSKIGALFIILFLSGYAMSQNNYYFVFLNTNPDKDEISKDSITKLQEKHLSNIDSLYKIGKLVAAGPFETGGGIFILVAPSLDSAQNILKSDPAIQAKRFKLEIYEFNFHMGSICQALEPFEMTTYHFIRYYKGVVQTDQNIFENLYMNHLQLYENYRDSMIVDGSFSREHGFVQVINMTDTEKIKNIIQQDSLVNQNYYYSEIKKLWIAKGTFCENK